jgi:hypothetical protein
MGVSCSAEWDRIAKCRAQGWFEKALSGRAPRCGVLGAAPKDPKLCQPGRSYQVGHLAGAAKERLGEQGGKSKRLHSGARGRHKGTPSRGRGKRENRPGARPGHRGPTAGSAMGACRLPIVYGLTGQHGVRRWRGARPAGRAGWRALTAGKCWPRHSRKSVCAATAPTHWWAVAQQRRPRGGAFRAAGRCERGSAVSVVVLAGLCFMCAAPAWRSAAPGLGWSAMAAGIAPI